MRFGTLSRDRPWVSAPGMRPVRSFGLWEPVDQRARSAHFQGVGRVGAIGGIPIVTLAEAGKIDVDIDGADAVDPRFNMIKGYGGALVREKIVAASSRRFVVLVGYEKIVKWLGERGPLPVEVIPFGLSLVTAKIKAMGMKPQVREKDGQQYITDNGNLILDCAVKKITNPARLDRELLAIPGVVGTGLFVALASVVLVAEESGKIRTLKR